MPEGHTIHRTARDHHKLFAGQSLLVLSPQGRFAHQASCISGQQLERVEAVGKHLLYHWQGGSVLHIHLGLYGKFRLHRGNSAQLPEPRGQVRLRVVGPQAAFDLNGPNCCELLDEPAVAALHERLGDDPLRDDADPQRVWSRISRSRAAIGTLLLNQSVVAGVGNIYRSELLYLLGIHPTRPGHDVNGDEFDRLWRLLVDLMQIGARYNRIIIADPADVGKPRARMKRDERLLVYKKKVCGRCGGPIECSMMAARKIYACGRCQC